LTIGASAVDGIDNLLLEAYYDKDGVDILLDDYKVTVGVVYYQMLVESIGQKGNQAFAINVLNKGIASSEYQVIIKRTDTDEILSTVDSSYFVDGRYVYSIDYDNKPLPNNTEILFELYTSRHNAFAFGTTVYRIAEGDIYNSNPIYDKELLNLLNRAKSLLV